MLQRNKGLFSWIRLRNGQHKSIVVAASHVAVRCGENHKVTLRVHIQFVAHVLESRFSPGRPQRHYKLTDSVSCH